MRTHGGRRAAGGPGLRLACFLGALALAACASEPPPPPPPPPTQAVIEVTAVPSLNPDAEGRPSPVVVRLYELTSPAPFAQADFFDLWDSDRATLGDSFVASEEYELVPGGGRTIERTLDDRTRALGFVAGFREVELSTWRAFAEVPANQTSRFALELDSLGIALKEAAP